MKCRFAVFISLCGGESLVITRNGGGGGANVRGVEDAAPLQLWDVVAIARLYPLISAHSDNFVRKIQRFVRSRLQGAAGYCTIIRVNVQNVPDKMTKKRPL